MISLLKMYKNVYIGVMKNEEYEMLFLFLIFKIVFISVDTISDTNLIEWRGIVVH